MMAGDEAGLTVEKLKFCSKYSSRGKIQPKLGETAMKNCPHERARIRTITASGNSL